METAWNREAGILLPVSSLPSKYGIGTFGKEAYDFIDKLVLAGQTYWQVLPIGPTSYGDSPYQSFSAFAGNPYFIDLEQLVEEGLLETSDVEDVFWGADRTSVDYETIYNNRFPVLKLAFKNSRHQETKEFKEFCKQQSYWLSDYSLYMAVKDSFDGREWLLWDEDIRFRKPEAVKAYSRKFEEEIAFYEFCQFKFYEQWNRLRAYANSKGIKIIGDIPIYVSLDSSDVWVHGDLFELDERKKPINVAGVPPDCFSEDGQRWGNPLYQWEAHEKTGFAWWKERIRANAKFYDVIRIDHFIGVVRYYSIPAENETAKEGCWRKGPGKKLTDALKEAAPEAAFIAEDLGEVVPAVRSLQQKTGWPGMKILEFAFDEPQNSNLPHNYIDRNMVVYGGTHDNEPLLGYFQGKTVEERKFAYRYLNIHELHELPHAVIRAGYASPARIVMNQMQDILCLDSRSKMNSPGVLGGNWQWRMEQGQFGEEEISWLRELSEVYGRLPVKEDAKKEEKPEEAENKENLEKKKREGKDKKNSCKKAKSKK